MKKQLFIIITSLILFLIPNINYGQAPNLGVASGFAIFTATGAVTNNGTSVINGDIGTNVGAFTGFPPGTINGQTHVADATTAQAATDVNTAYTYLYNLSGTVIGVGLGNGQTLLPGTYSTGAASTLNGTITLDGQNNPNSLFIIKIGGAFATGTHSNVILINSASLCNVYWQIGGQFDLGDSSVFKGTIVADGAINLLQGSTLFGRGLSRAGAISLYNNVVAYMPAAAGTITGNYKACQSQNGVIYSVPPINNTTGYIWTLPTGATIISGVNTNSITVNFSSTASSGNITVSGTNACGSGIASSNYAITVSALPTTSAIYHQ